MGSLAHSTSTKPGERAPCVDIAHNQFINKHIHHAPSVRFEQTSSSLAVKYIALLIQNQYERISTTLSLKQLACGNFGLKAEAKHVSILYLVKLVNLTVGGAADCKPHGQVRPTFVLILFTNKVCGQLMMCIKLHWLLCASLPRV